MNLRSDNILPHISRKAAILSGLICTFIFLVFTLLLVKQQLYLVWLVAPALLIVLLSLISLDRFYLLLLFLTPLSLQLRFLIPSSPIDIFLPTELMLVIILILTVFKIFKTGEFDRKGLLHPASVLIGLSLAWIFITIPLSTSFLVSLKAGLAKTWFLLAFYFLALELFKIPKLRDKAFKALIFGMVPVLMYHMVRLLSAGLFNQKAAHITMWPFFNDHTSFGAALAFLIPLIVYFIFTAKSRISRILFAGIGLLFLLGFIFSYSRAAWISLVLALLFASIYLLKIPWKLVFMLVIGGGLVIALSWTSIQTKLESNSQGSSGDMTEHIQSIANISTDASNLERINRWKSALRMIKEKPLFGWGPGTYQFEYAPYQFSNERTIISTNFGDRGNAHSEYLGAAVESGLPSAIIFCVILLIAFICGNRVWQRDVTRETRVLVLSLMSGLFTYVIHGALNNFLDTDKIAAPFWMFIAAIVALDLSTSAGIIPEKGSEEKA